MKKRAILAAAGTYALLSGTIYYEIMHRNGKLLPTINHLQKRKDNGGVASRDDARAQWTRAQTFTAHTLVNDRGQKLRGWHLPPQSPSDVFVLCAHGYRSRGKSEFRFLTKFYHDAGFHVFLVDHQAAGESDGAYISFGYYESDDLLQWMRYLNATFGDGIQIVLHGVSMGSATVMMACGDPDLPKNVRFAVADCGYTDMTAELRHALRSMHLPSFPIVQTADRIQKTFFGFPFAAVSPIRSVRQTRVPMLFIHGEKDPLVPVHMAQALYDACAAEKELLIVPDAVHGESHLKDPDAYEGAILRFAEKYLSKK